MCALEWYKYSLLLFPSDATSNKNIAKLQVFNPLAVSFNRTCLSFLLFQRNCCICYIYIEDLNKVDNTMYLNSTSYRQWKLYR